MGFDMKSFMGQHESAPKQTDFIIHNIAITDLVPSSENFYGMREIEDLAVNIEQNGLLHQLVVRQVDDNGKFSILSGERRYRACMMLYEAGDMRFASLPCTIRETQNDLLAELQLIAANAQREKTDYERTREIVRTKELLLQMKEQGYKFSGRMRDKLAEMFDVSPGQVGRAEKIAKDLSPALQDEFKAGTLGVTDAYDLAGKPEAIQTAAARELQETGKIQKPKKETAPKPPAHDTVEDDAGSLEDELERIISEGPSIMAGKMQKTVGGMAYYFSNDKNRREFLDTFEEWGLWFEEPRLGVKYYRCELPNRLQIIVEKQDDTKPKYFNGEYSVKHQRFHAVFLGKGDWDKKASYANGYGEPDPPCSYDIAETNITAILYYMDKPKGLQRILVAADLAAREKEGR